MSNAVIGYILAICSGFTVICIAVGWVIKIVKGVRKPVDEVEEKLARDYKRINELERQMDELRKQIDELVVLSKGLVSGVWNILEHLDTDNNTGGMKKCKEDLLKLLQQH